MLRAEKYKHLFFLFIFLKIICVHLCSSMDNFFFSSIHQKFRQMFLEILYPYENIMRVQSIQVPSEQILRVLVSKFCSDSIQRYEPDSLNTHPNFQFPANIQKFFRRILIIPGRANDNCFKSLPINIFCPPGNNFNFPTQCSQRFDRQFIIADIIGPGHSWKENKVYA